MPQQNSPTNIENGENSIQYTSGGFANRFVNRSFTLAKIKENSGAKYKETSKDDV